MSKIHVQYTNKRVRRRPDALLAELILALSNAAPDPLIVAIGGPGGCGKTTLARKISQRLLEQSCLLYLPNRELTLPPL